MNPTSESAVARATLGAYLRVRAGEAVTVEAWSSALDWARALVLEARRRDVEPILVVEDEDGFFRSLEGGGPVPTAPATLARLGGAYVYLSGPEAFPRAFGLEPEERRAVVARHGPAWRAAARGSGLRAVALAVAGVGPTAAARFGVGVDAWREEVVRASLVPPARLRATAGRLVRRLARARRLTVRHANGTRLELAVRPGRWLEEAAGEDRGRHRFDPVWSSVPTGRLTVPVAPGSANGRWEANRPHYDRWGESPVGDGGRFRFADGRLEEYAFDRGGEEFASLSAASRRAPGIVRALTVGLNPAVVRAPEVGDLSLGRLGLCFQLGRPQGRTGVLPGEFVSALHGAEVDLDGRPWLSDGQAVRARGGSG